MQSIAKIIQDENLINLQFDSKHISTVLSEILTLFKDQQNRILKLESDVADCPRNSDFNHLSNVVDTINSEVVAEFDSLNKKMTELKEKTEESINDIHEKAEAGNLSTLGEARRLITAEIRQNSNDEKVKLLEERLAETDTDLRRVINELDTLVIPSTNISANPSVENSSIQLDHNNAGAATALKITKLEKKIEELDLKVQNFPQVEQNVNDIMVQFPLMVRKVEKKVNDLIKNPSSVVQGKGNAKQDDDILGEMPPPPSFPEITEQEINQPVVETTVTTTSQPQGNLLSAFTGPNRGAPRRIESINSDHVIQQLIQKEVDNDDENTANVENPDNEVVVPKAEKIEVMGELDMEAAPDTLSMPFKPVKASETFNRLKANINQPSDISIHSSRTENGKVIKVFENRTYKTEMNSSVRVVSELEWAKNLIQQHHDAIRQLQQNLRTQQENFDTVTEALQRVNATHNSRIAQIAQQFVKFKQDSDESERKITESLNKVSAAAHSARMQANKPPVTETVYVVKEKEKIPKKKKKLDLIKPLEAEEENKIDENQPIDMDQQNNVNEDENEHDQENEVHEEFLNRESTKSIQDIQKKATTARKFNLRSLEDDKIDNESSILTQKENQQNSRSGETRIQLSENIRYARRNYTLSSTHFQIQPRSYMFSDIRTISESSGNAISHLELFNRAGYGGQTIPLQVNPADGSETNHAQENLLAEQILQRNEMNNQPKQIVMTPQMLQIGSNLPRREYHEFSMDDIPSDLIEEKVSVLARKVVTILADSAKRDIQKEADSLKKTVDIVVTQVDGKIDREFVERMFNKFRVALNEMNEKIDNLQCSFLEWVTRDELELVLQNFTKVIADVKDTAAVKSKYNCLLCGRPRQHLAGMMIKKEALVRGPAMKGNDKYLRSSADSAILKPSVNNNSVFDNDFLGDGKGTRSTLEARTQQLQFDGQQLQVPPRSVVQYLTET
ncbi:hypothetical protein TRFO_04560 [Tritrichomonas foetus]|uniref:Uncharacterized protein n=1 Tax=Tritrichomonas foetus TaxID=1144522 RepID=A0A1J4KJE9_9EUKA|nr:hypothetical protein TRFO_04560 [Tritrichomonas foetus]|eukprot:OHT09477.1 hypothetical protein TRFO_04560 [Tritrichomonas foetus]